jgi:hypothetical protein
MKGNDNPPFFQGDIIAPKPDKLPIKPAGSLENKITGIGACTVERVSKDDDGNGKWLVNLHGLEGAFSTDDFEAVQQGLALNQ